MRPGETNSNLRVIFLSIYDSDGLPASGEAGEGAVATVTVATQLQTNRNLAGYINAVNSINHIGDGFYSYAFDATEIAGSTQGSILLRFKKSGFRTQVVSTALEVGFDVSDIFNHVVEGTKTYAQMLRIFNAILRGKAQLTPSNEIFYGEDESTVRWSGTIISNIRTISTEDGDP